MTNNTLLEADSLRWVALAISCGSILLQLTLFYVYEVKRRLAKLDAYYLTPMFVLLLVIPLQALLAAFYVYAALTQPLLSDYGEVFNEFSFYLIIVFSVMACCFLLCSLPFVSIRFLAFTAASCMHLGCALSFCVLGDHIAIVAGSCATLLSAIALPHTYAIKNE